MSEALFYPTKLSCEYQENPLGLDVLIPRLSWKMKDDRLGAMQSAYRIIVSSSMEYSDQNKGDFWDSKMVSSDESVNLNYKGMGLKPGTIYYWKVKIWDKEGQESAWSDMHWWETGLLTNEQWKAKWVSMKGHEAGKATPHLRKSFSVDQKIIKARLYITAKGLYQAFINGQKVSDDRFRPGWTDYNIRIPYQTYDVTELLKNGENVLGSIIADGWYCGYAGFIYKKKPNGKIYGDYPEFLAQLEITMEDGSKEIITTDNSWKVNSGPILFSDMLLGEHYDAGLEMPGWNEPGFDDSGWLKVVATNMDSVKLEAQYLPPVKAVMELEPVNRTQIDVDKQIYDMGQNMVGVIRLNVKGKKGIKVTIRYAEVLDENGNLYTDNLRGATNTDFYILKSDQEEIFEPLFTYHGFRYVEVSSMIQSKNPYKVKGIVLSSATTKTGSFVCSDALVTQIQSNITWSQRGNFFEIPTDCPQRDERLGWTGDAEVFINTACFNRNVASFFTKWAVDVRDAQREDGAFTDVAPNILRKKEWGTAGWGDAGVICPWSIYKHYGDVRILEENYESMKLWIAYLKENSKELIRPNKGYGDWVSVDADTPKDLIGTAFFAYSTKLVSKIADVLGKKKDAKEYEDLYHDIRKAFKKKFIAPTGYVTGGTQSSILFALNFDLLPVKNKNTAAYFLQDDIKWKNGHISTGFLGVRFMMPTLTELGMVDLAYDLLLNETYPSWGYTIRNGATTIWENFNAWTSEEGFLDPKMNSFNHYSFGSVGEWMYSAIGGIYMHPAAVAYKEIIIKPHLGGGLTSAASMLESPYGLIKSDWKIRKDIFYLTVIIPANTTARIVLPGHSEKESFSGDKELMKDKALSKIVCENGTISFSVGAGTYRFRSKM